jgi:enoyl-CoA hydratase/carnithine racemase
MPLNVIDHDGGIRMIVIDNPAKRNALDERMYRQLAALWKELAQDPGCRAVILTGSGGAFCSGADLAENLMALPDVDTFVDEAFLKSAFFPKPIIAAIDGACVAGGLELALGCDVRLASTSARIGLPEPRWGIFPSGGGARKLADEIGYARATELLLTGRLIGAQEALALGLISEVVAPERLTERALAVAAQIAANSPAACYAIKRYLHAARAPSTALASLEDDLTAFARDADLAEGVAAFLGKREPIYPPLDASRTI